MCYWFHYSFLNYRFSSCCISLTCCLMYVTVVKKNLCNKNWCNNMTIVRLNFQQMLYILRIFGTFTNTWPPYPNIGKNELILRNLYYYVAIFTLTVAWILMTISAYKNRNDVGILMKNMSHIAAFTEAILNSILCRIKKKQLQVNIFIIKNIF